MPFITQDDLYFFMAEADTNADGMIEYNEFIPIALQIIQTMYSRKQFEEKKKSVQQQAKNILVHGMDKNELERVLATIFKSFDTDGSGALSQDEFVEALSSMDLGLTRKEINSVLFHYDANSDGSISYTEFVPFAFDLLSKLTEMRIFETEMAEDDLAKFLVELFKARETELEQQEEAEAGAAAAAAERPPGMMHIDIVKELLHMAKLGLTRLQIYSVMSVAEVNELGFINYMQFIPRAVSMMNSMISFEADLVDKVATEETAAIAQEILQAMPDPSPLPDIQQRLMAAGGDLSQAEVRAICLAAQQYGYDECAVGKLIEDVPGIIMNLKKANKAAGAA